MLTRYINDQGLYKREERLFFLLSSGKMFIVVELDLVPHLWLTYQERKKRTSKMLSVYPKRVESRSILEGTPRALCRKKKDFFSLERKTE